MSHFYDDLMVIEIIIESSFAELLSKPHVELQQFLPSKREKGEGRFNWIRFGLVYSHIKYP